MVDNLTPADRRKTMQAVKGKGTKPERRLAAMLAGMRLNGWRKNAQDLPGKPDIIFDHAQIAIFIDGCFWHGCPYCRRKLPKTNRTYWKNKIQRNVASAKKTNQILLDKHWIVLRIWEHELNNPIERSKIRTKIRQTLQQQ